MPVNASTNRIIPYSVRLWQMEDGLPQNSVYALAQTTDGYLWVGTHEGLARFDGIRFTTLDEKIAPDLKHGWITALCAGRDGSLWAACDGTGLVRVKNGACSRFSETNGLLSNQIHCLYEGRDGSIWIGSEFGLTQFKDGKFQTFTDKSLSDISVRGIFEDHEGQIRLATRRGLRRLTSDGIADPISFGTAVVPNTLKAVWEDHNRDFWVTSNEGVTRARGQERDVYTTARGLPNNLCTVLYEDRASRMWAGTYSGLACIVDGKVVSTPLNEAALADLVYAIVEDHEENLWVGGRDGLYCLRPARFATFTTQEGLSYNNVMSVMEDRSGAICMATWGGGLNRLQGNQIFVNSETNGLNHNFALSLHEAHDGTLWVGMDRAGGVNRLSQDRKKITFHQDGLPVSGAVRVIYQDSAGIYWVGTKMMGLSVQRHGKFVNYTAAKGLAGNDVMVIHEDADKNIWIGTDGGLSRWDNDKFVNLTTQDGLAHNVINAIYEDDDHTLWIGTRGGLNRFKDGKFTTYTTRQGLFNDDIYEILEDDLGSFWMSCRKGIFRISKRDFDEIDRGNSRTVTCTVFGKADGLVSVQCNGVAKPAGWKARDGRLWFPTIRGVVAVEPTIKPNDKPPPVVIEEVIADQKTLRSAMPSASDTSPLVVPAGRGEIEIHFAALSFQAPEKNRFEYQIKEIDSDWLDGTANRVARYNNIAPGNYHFRVRACNNDGVWSADDAATLALVFQPHYWQTWWFRAGVIIAVALLLTALYQARLKQLREIENLRVQIAADLHDDVGSRLTKVAMVTESMDAETPETDQSKPHIRNIAKTTSEIIQAMDEIVWTINPKNDTLDNLANYIFQYAQDYFQNSGVRCRMDLPTRLPELTVATQERHNLFMAVKEALNNVLKHAHATEVRISLAATDSTVTITVVDNGRGFTPETCTQGRNGIYNMQKRLERIGGELKLNSKIGSGTTVKMEAKGL